MLQSVRDNLKGTLMVIVVIIFIIPMVISGVGTTFLNSVAGTDFAKVNGDEISKTEVARAVQIQRNNMIASGKMKADDEQLSDEKLTPLVAESMIRRAALVTQAKKHGMAAAEDAFAQTLMQQQAFQSNGKFDPELYKRLIGARGYTPAGFKKRVMEDLVIQQQDDGLRESSFSTKKELGKIIAFIEQKRSYFGIKIDKKFAAQDVQPSDEQIQKFYTDNAARFTVPEKVKIQYLELGLDDLAKEQVVSDDEVKAQYESEIKNFKSDFQYTIAHILVENKNSDVIDKVKAGLAKGEAFDKLAAKYSDDLATNSDGGMLGVMVAGVYPKSIEDAVEKLDVGQVSEPIVADDGVHFVKLVDKEKQAPPSLASREKDIRWDLAKIKAKEDYANKTELLSEYTFSADNLKDPAKELGLTVKESDFFDKNSGTGIAQEPSVRNAAFDDDVLINGHNSALVELSGDRQVVVRVEEKKPSHVRPLDEVKPLIVAQLTRQMESDALEALAKGEMATIQSVDDAKKLAEDKKYQFFQQSSVKRSAPDVNPELNYQAFSAPYVKGKLTAVVDKSMDGGVWIIGVTSVEDGQLSDLEEKQRQNYSQLLAQQNALFEAAAYQRDVIANSKIKRYE